ncbi:hypothetical protein OPV22_009594 [Ensete ventricosum]|uniref:Growth-regulating factor n=1 Tax=Ensete ventricosum TaxID=4639 RepID=A0AAV8RDN9_ENSVE|nr:hypothetical protein OPV22_009594 [Ensete ventricosum]
MNSFAAGCRPPFTATQWQELEHQALILKYLMAGVPVPPELIIPIRRGFEALPGRYYHPSLSYYSYYGKKPDPEPGRCRRTDGKKWRCSKDAYPGSKYCERHMHRGRNRSRKPVESQTVSPSQTSSSTLTSLSPSGSNAGGTGVGSFRSITLQSIAGPSNAQNSCLGGAGSSRLQMDTDSLGNRYSSGLKPDVDEHSFFSEASGTARALGVDSSVDSSWLLVPPQVSSFPMSKSQDLSVLQSAYSQLQTVQDLGQVKMSSLSRQEQQQHSFFGSEFGSSEPVKHETQFLRPFFDEWPKTRDAWSDLEEDRSNRTSFSTTQLSISIPMAASDFSSTSSMSPNGGSLS